MHENLQVLCFPVVAFSQNGWTKAADDADELTEASLGDGLTELLGLEICDSSGHLFVVEKVWCAFPKTSLGAWFCKVTNHGVYAGFQFSEPALLALEDLKQRLRFHHPSWTSLDEAHTHRELIEMLL